MRTVRPTNPLHVIALFVGLSEIGFGLAAGSLPDAYVVSFVAIMVGLAVLVFGGFFTIVFFRPQNLYGPADYRSDEAYVTLNRRVDDIEALTKLIDEKIETMPMYKYARLPEHARRLFLLVYHPD